jgi:transcriptional regulator with XRE-family HTH domain
MYETKGGNAMTFGERMRKRRNEIGKTLAEVASTLGKSENAVRSYMPYEKGTYLKPPSLNALRIRKHRQKRKR